MQRRRPMGALEAQVLGVLWASAEPLTPRAVHRAMGEDLAYTTVTTILTRLWGKGLVHRERRGRAYTYAPVMSEAELTAARMQAVLEATSDHAAVLRSFVGRLDRQDEQALGTLLRSLDQR